MRARLRSNAQSRRDTPTDPDRRSSRLTRLGTAGLALFALAAAPMSHAASDGVPDAVASAVSTTVATLASTTLEAATSDAQHGLTQPEARSVRSVTATPTAYVEHVALRSVADSGDEPDEAEVADEPAEEEVAEEEAETDPSGANGADDQDAADGRSVWDRLADCESGEWVNGGDSFIEGSARWDYGIDFAHEGYEQFQGGLNFHPGTWDAYRDPDMPGHAGNASREQEIIVGERVLDAQGWGAWPVCSEMIGLR